MKIKNFAIGCILMLGVFLTLAYATPAEAAQEPFVWDGWITFYSLSVDQNAGSLQVAFGRRGKSATIYARIMNDTALRVRGSVSFDLVDGETGKVKADQYAPFKELMPGAVDQSMGNWFMVPDRTLTANVYNVRNIRLKELWVPLPSDPNGPLYEYYPNNRLAAKQQELQDAEKRRADTEQQRQAAERQQQQEAAQRQRDQQQRQREEEARRAERDRQRVVDDANRQAQQHVDQYNRQVQGAQETYRAGQDSKAEYERRKREIEERYANADNDVDYSEVERALKSAEFYADLKRKAEAEVRNYRNQASYQTGAQQQVTLAAAAVMQTQVDKNAREEAQYRETARNAERKAKQEARQRQAERKQQELDRLATQAENTKREENTNSVLQPQLSLPSNNLPIPETPMVYVPPTPEQVKANQNLLAAWMAMSGNEDISKDAATWPAVSQAILQGATDFNYKNVKTGATLLHYAAGNNDVAALKYLLNHRIPGNVVDKFERLPLEYAATYDCVEAAVFLMEKGATRDQLNAALIGAASNNSEKVTSLLLTQDIDVNAVVTKSGYPTTALMTAASRNGDKVIPLLLARGADVNLDSPLAMAAYGKYVRGVELLLAAGADVNQSWGSTRVTPIFYAVDPYGPNSNFEILEKLVAAGADVKSHDSFGKSVLHYVDDANADKTIPLLVAAGANINATVSQSDSPYYKRTPLHEAVIYKKIQVIEQLLNIKEIDVNAKDRDKKTSLHHAVNNTYSDTTTENKNVLMNIVKMLLAAGANPNLQEDDGDTPLHYAGRLGNYEAYEMLLQAGAKRNIKNADGKTPDYYMKDYNNWRKKNKK